MILTHCSTANSRSNSARTHEATSVDTSSVGPTSTFAAISDPHAQQVGRGLPILGGDCIQLEVRKPDLT